MDKGNDHVCPDPGCATREFDEWMKKCLSPEEYKKYYNENKKSIDQSRLDINNPYD